MALEVGILQRSRGIPLDIVHLDLSFRVQYLFGRKHLSVLETDVAKVEVQLCLDDAFEISNVADVELADLGDCLELRVRKATCRLDTFVVVLVVKDGLDAGQVPVLAWFVLWRVPRFLLWYAKISLTRANTLRRSPGVTLRFKHSLHCHRNGSQKWLHVSHNVPGLSKGMMQGRTYATQHTKCISHPG
jgi:hypothetical protein